MLQQTRIRTVVPYYERFLDRFPSVESLAAAEEADVLALWSGLGYYSRARSLRKAAGQIVEAGQFPRNHSQIRALPGVGDYTAAAIASIAFSLPCAVLDGNVMRVLSRLSNDAGDIRAAATRVRFQRLADRLLDRTSPGLFNQALMELGATVCTARSPQCQACPVSRHCEALAKGTQQQLPVKLRTKTPVVVEQTLLLIERNRSFLMWQRPPASRRMAGFWELPADDQLPMARVGPVVGRFLHSITCHNYRVTLCRGSIRTVPPGFEWRHRKELDTLLLSTTARKAFSEAFFQ